VRGRGAPLRRRFPFARKAVTMTPMTSFRRFLPWLSGVLVLLGGGLLFWGMEREVPVRVDDAWLGVRTRALTVGGILRDAGATPQKGDRLIPAVNLSTWWWQAPLVLEHARPVSITLWPQQRTLTLESAERIPANLLAEAGLRLFPHDQLLWQGHPIDPALPLPAGQPLNLTLRQAVPFAVVEGGQSRVYYSAAETLGQALAEQGITPGRHDRLQPPAAAPLTAGLQVQWYRARPLTVRLQGTEITIQSAAATVGEALAEAGISLQGLDYSLPAEDQPLPEDGIIQVVRVQEEVVLEQSVLPFKTEYEFDPQTELDQKRVLEPGEYGLEVTRSRVRYADGQEVARTTEARWLAKEPKPQRVGYGTRVVIRTLETPDGPIEYWRAVTVYATSYSPCRLGIEGCSTATASGLPLKRGIIAVSRAWYSWMLGQRLYVPGYGFGVVADAGGGIPGRYWVDLGYSDDDYQPWHQYVTIYFLTPVPSAIPWILP